MEEKENKNKFVAFIAQQLFTALLLGIYLLLRKVFKKYTDKYNFTKSEKWVIVIILYIILLFVSIIFNSLFN